jgi:hypothetical protein
MFLRKFKSSTPDVMVLILIITLLIWIRPIIHPGTPSSLGFELRPMPLFSLLLHLTGKVPLISVLFALIILLLSAFLLVNFNTSEFFLNERTFLPALFFVLISGLFPVQQVLNPALPGSVFLILAVRRIMDSYKVRYVAYSFFDAGLLISTGSLFYAPIIWFGLLLVVGLALLRTGNLKEIIISALGIITPWFIISGIYYVAGDDPFSVFSDLTYNLYTKRESAGLPMPDLIAVVATGFILLLSTLDLFSTINTNKIKSRKTFRLLLWALIITAGLYVAVPGVSIEAFWLAAVPASYLLTHFFINTRRKFISELWFSVLLGSVFAVQIGYIVR